MNNQGSTRTPRDSYRKGDRLPSIVLEDVSREVAVSLRRSRGPRVVVVLHRRDCDECASYVERLATTRESLDSWGGDLVIVSPEAEPASSSGLAELGVPVLADPEHVVANGRLTVFIADEWGRLYFASQPKGTHDPIDPDEVVEWVKFIAIQCPECEGPEGEWRNV